MDQGISDISVRDVGYKLIFMDIVDIFSNYYEIESKSIKLTMW